MLAAAAVALALSVVTIPQELRAIAIAAGGALYLLWTVGYFVTFWTTTGQTPGSRALRIRVRSASGARLRPRRALLRFAGLTLAAASCSPLIWVEAPRTARPRCESIP